MTSIETMALANVRGGARGQSRDQIRQRYANMCTGKDARAQYDTLVTQMTSDRSEEPGIKRRALVDLANLCHWPPPPPSPK
jgi:hypothetical protein